MTSQRPKSSLAQHAPDHLFIHLIAVLFWSIVTFLTGPMLIWLVLTVLVPTMISAVDKTGTKTDHYIAHLSSVVLAEGKFANILNYNGGLSENAWPYRFADRLARKYTPEERGSEYVDSRNGQRLEEEGRGRRFNENGDQIAPDGQKAVVGYLSGWLDDRFWTIQAKLIGFGVPRFIYALYIYVLFLPAILTGWFLGRYSARLRKRANIGPMQVRYQVYKWIAMSCLILLPTLCLIPYAFPAAVVMFVICLIGSVAWTMASRHFVEI